MRRQSVLYLTCHLPYPPIGGGRRRDYELIRRLADQFDLKLCVVSKTPREDRRNAAKLKEYCSAVQIFSAGTGAPIPMERAHQVARHSAAGARSWVGDLVFAGGADVVHVEGYYLMQHVTSSPSAPVLLVEENVEYLLFRQEAAIEPDLARQRHLCRQYELTKATEIAAWRRATVCGAVSAEDRRHMQQAAPGVDVRLTSDGADHLDSESSPSSWRGPTRRRSPSIVFIANFGYEPNVDAAAFLCRQILPHIRATVPDVRVSLVGADPGAKLLELGNASRVAVVGTVPSVVPYLEGADVVVCPLRVGGGVKVKLLEAIRRGKAIVTTSVGAQGMPHGIATCIEVRDDPVGFAEASVGLLTSERKRRELEHAAASLGATLPTWDDAASVLSACYRELARPNDTRVRWMANGDRRVASGSEREPGGEKCGT